jgi:N-acyl-D-aspartate/D-glutamate deacylase/dipeptidyl aminopeptidase/acylaminoacyl peptidase
MKIKGYLPLLIPAMCLIFYFTGTSAKTSNSNEDFTIEQVLSSPFPSDLVASSKGQRIAWVFDAQGRRNVWAAEGPEFKARQLTQFNEDTGQEITEPEFTHDGKFVIFVRGGNENSAGEVPNPTSDPEGARQEVLAVSVENGRVIKLGEGSSPVAAPRDNRVVFNRDGQIWVVEIAEGSEPHRYFIARGTNGSPEWSPDGRKLAFVSSRGTHSYIGIYDTEKNTVSYVAPSVDRDGNPRWSPDGTQIAFTRQPARDSQPRPLFQDIPDPWSIMVADLKTGTSREIWRSGNTVNDSIPGSGKDQLQWGAGDRLVFTSEQDGWRHLYSIPVSGGEPKLLTPGSCEYEDMTLTPDRSEIFYSSNCGDIDRRHISRVSVTDGTARPVTSGNGIEWAPIATGDGAKLAYFYSTARIPASVRVRNLNGSDSSTTAVAADTLPKDFPASKLVDPQQVIFKAEDGLEIHGQLFLPAGAKPGEKLPSVIFMHGGPMRQMFLGWHNRYYYHNAYGFNQYLANRGYAVLSVNYRLGIGYGRAFRKAKDGGGGGASEYKDIVAGAKFLQSRSDIEPSKIGLWGGSYGGYLTALGLARNSDIFAAGVDLHGVHDWSQRISRGTWIDYGNRDAVKIARDASPLGSVEKWRSPVLLIHGDDDRNVAFSQTVDLVKRLRDQKVEFEQIVYPDEVHDFLLHRHWLEIYHAATVFFDKHLKSAGAAPAQKVSRVDILIRGGRVIDGSGSNAFRADVGITGDRISFVGDAAKEGIQAGRTIDASGLTLSPGFIDPHTHTWEDLSSPLGKSNQPFLFQGVTTVLTGNDGSSPFPVGEALDKWQRNGIGTNAALFVGHGTIRNKVMGPVDSAPTADQLAKMKAMVRQAMNDGAMGISTGLYYAPGSFAKTEEVIELAKVAAELGGSYDTHVRDESSYNIGLLGSVNETIRIGREAGIPVHFSHIKALGTDVWGKSAEVIEIINKAIGEGVRVTANQYPYTASGTSLTASLVPRWAEDGGNEQMIKRIDDAATRPRLIADMEKNLKRRGGADSLLITSSRDRSIVGKRLDAIAASWKKPPIEAALQIIKNGGASVASFNMNEKDIENFMRQPWVMTGSDGSGGHPRKYGTFPRKIREYVFNRKVITLPRMIQSSSLQVAETFRLRDRGRLATGFMADLIVFDEQTVSDKSTYEQPQLFAEGMKYVFVNGQAAIDGGKYTGALAGRALGRQ